MGRTVEILLIIAIVLLVWCQCAGEYGERSKKTGADDNKKSGVRNDETKEHFSTCKTKKYPAYGCSPGCAESACRDLPAKPQSVANPFLWPYSITSCVGEPAEDSQRQFWLESLQPTMMHGSEPDHVAPE